MKKIESVIYFCMNRLTGEQAYMTSMVLERMARGLWLAHGDEMADFQGRVFPDDPPSPYTCVYCNRRTQHDDDRF